MKWRLPSFEKTTIKTWLIWARKGDVMPVDKFKSEQIVKSWQGPKSVCACGHLGDGRWSQHEGTVTIIQNGHGKCLEPGCGCGRFAFKQWTAAFLSALRDAGVQA